MNTYYKARIDFDTKINDIKTQKESRIILLDSINYEQAENFTIDLIKKELFGEYTLNITKVKYDNIFPISNDKDELYFYEVRITSEIIDDKGNTKYATEKVLIQAESLEDAVEKADKKITDNIDETYLSAVLETDIEEYYSSENINHLKA